MKMPPSDPAAAAPALPPNWERHRQELLAGEVIHLWQIDLRAWTDAEPALHALLSSAESERFARLHRQEDRTRSIVARGVLRQLLAASLATPARPIFASLLAIQEGNGEKPYLAENPLHLDFNIAHSGDWALIALLANGAVGVDVERMRNAVEIDAIAPTLFTAREWEPVATLDEDRRRIAFFRGWVRKEALIKAMGEGLRAPLLQIEVGCSPSHRETQTARLLPAANPPAASLPSAAATPWRVTDLAAPAGYCAALAWAGKTVPARLFHATSTLLQCKMRGTE